MKRSTLLVGFLLLIAVDTFVQIGFKLAGEAAAPTTLDLDWLQRATRTPWTYAVLAGYGTAFLLFMTIIKHAPIGPAFAASHMEIVTVTLISVLFFGESITWLQAIGCVLIVSGVVVLAATEAQSES